MANTKIRGNTQIRDNTIDINKLDNVGLTNGQGFLDGSDWDITAGNINATITGVKNPVNAQDVATKIYVDNVAAGLDPKESVRVATTEELIVTSSGLGEGKTLTATSTGVLVIDGITLVNGDRVLIKDQTDAVNNGIYIVTSTGSVSTAYILTRAIDFDGTPSNEVSGGAFAFVESGTINANTGWVVSADGSITVDTNDIDWVQFSGAGSYTAGDGLDLVGGQFSVDVTDIIDTAAGLGEDGSNNIQVKVEADGAIVFDGVNGGLEVNVDATTIEIATNTLQVKADGINDTHIDWGVGANQVSAVDMPIADAGTLFATDNVEAALAEVMGDVNAIEDNGILGGNGIITSGTIGADTLTVSADVDGTSITATGGTGAQLAVTSTGINETHLDLGSGSNQIDATTIPLDSGGTYAGLATNLQDAIEELEAALPLTRYYAEEVTVTNNSAITGALSNLPVEANTEAVYLNGIRQQPGGANDYTINITTGVITFTDNLHINDKVIVDYAS